MRSKRPKLQRDALGESLRTISRCETILELTAFTEPFAVTEVLSCPAPIFEAADSTAHNHIFFFD